MRNLRFLLLLLSSVFQSFKLCASISAEGRALLRFRESIDFDPNGALSNWEKEEENEVDYCYWFGVICSDDSRVVALNLQNLGLEGIISPHIGDLIHLRIIDLSNNSLYGVIPREIGELKQMVILDLRNNSLSGSLPSNLANILSLKLLLIKGNSFSDNSPPELLNLISISEKIETNNNSETSENRYIQKINTQPKRRQLRDSPKSVSSSPSPSPAPPTATPPPPQTIQPPPVLPYSPPVKGESVKGDSEKKKNILGVVLRSLVGVVGVIGAVSIGLVLYVVCFRVRRANVVLPGTGCSGPITRALVEGVKLIGRTELEAACEDFSNIIINLEDCKIYKGTLSGGQEIAVISTLATSALEWSELDEDQFQLKMSNLSKINHKNFMNLLGYCEFEQPFTRMLVVEYAPNGTLFEHLHIKEAEQLDWPARLRIAMGTIYNLEYIDKLNLPRLKSLNSSTIYLSEDYAAKVSDIGFRVSKPKPITNDDNKNNDNSVQQEPIIYKYAILLLEIISGRLPFSEDTGLLILWASSYLNGKRELSGMVDPSLNGSVPDDVLVRICDVIRDCINPNFYMRPGVADVARQMQEISRVSPEMAIPRNSPLWWAELEIASGEGAQ